MKLPRPIQDMRTIKKLLTAAESEARRAGDELPGPEHLLLAAFDLPDDTARRAFERAGADPAGFRAAIDDTHQRAMHDVGVQVAGPDRPLPEAAPATGPYRLTAPGQEVFQAAVRLAKAGSGSPLRGAHVVAAIGGQQRGTVARALRTLGVERAALTAAADQVLTER
ncbi:Clp protease ATP-binding protein [Actinoplanes sp. SE50]|uniref:Clp protease N-terminal domain-containing protein n=1 Tax=unclassified Actinoplanes TaxID=2626549 RepID=UPI00023ECCA4|nr:MULTISPECIES: Clp protease N-terminal domain-containing protein [unclassified Actinoplanes]AEV84299.1 Clp domain protein [Actinoplanes sp. SE50/110]ATO82691.1 Clp protease ATP-binding protein [Actinoplanes sp. SE50]SLM00098.1 Clp protease ATP-binding protein [Actinoplanes sp. SE50/110]